METAFKDSMTIDDEPMLFVEECSTHQEKQAEVVEEFPVYVEEQVKHFKESMNPDEEQKSTMRKP